MFRRVDYKLKARLEPSAKQWCMAIGDKILNSRYAPSIIKCLSELGIVETRLLCILNRLPRCSDGVPLESLDRCYSSMLGLSLDVYLSSISLI
jgi:hypothetical protein